MAGVKIGNEGNLRRTWKVEPRGERERSTSFGVGKRN
jgi:hypothetical protein